ncbi:MAG: transposase [Burkholderiaceae bacterium]|nr:transposase [Burkholderiaceae bacterium]
MISVASIIERFEADYLTQYQNAILPSHRQALHAMKLCRSTSGVHMLAQCSGCEEQRFVPHSCGHRNCPHCQQFESQQWIERQTRKLVPGSYFLITFTLPAELRGLAWHHQRTVYATLMECAWDTLCTFSQNHKHLQGSPGAVAVLHTHSRRLEFHPHVHLTMPAAALDADKRLWRTLRRSAKGDGYLFNHKALAKVFRAKLLATLMDAGLALPPDLPEKWVVDCKSVGNGEKALVYLGRYLYRGVIQEKDIIRCEGGQVTYRYRDSKTKKLTVRTVSGATFLWLVLQHVLPKGFRRSRNYGFLHPNSKRLIELLKLLVFKLAPSSPATPTPRPQLLCTCCGAAMVIIRRRILPAEIHGPGGEARQQELAL